jgi:heme exporter protein A
VQLVAENLVLSRGGRTVIDGLTVRLSPGDALVLTGANGTGKTTLLRALGGFLAPVAGRVRFDGTGEREGRELVHFVGHLDGVKPHLTVAENLAFWTTYLGGGGGDARLEGALSRFGLSALAGIPAGYLSAGQKRRLALARLQAVSRPVWLLDEPTVSLDTSAVAQLTALLDEHVAAGGIAVVATHIPVAVAGAKVMRLGAPETAA